MSKSTSEPTLANACKDATAGLWHGSRRNSLRFMHSATSLPAKEGAATSCPRT